MEEFVSTQLSGSGGSGTEVLILHFVRARFLCSCFLRVLNLQSKTNSVWQSLLEDSSPICLSEEDIQDLVNISKGGGPTNSMDPPHY